MTRVALSFRSGHWLRSDERLEILDTVMAGLPLDGVVTLATYDEITSGDARDVPTYLFWSNHSPKWPLLQRVRLAPLVTRGFIVMLENDGGGETPLLPSLTELAVVGLSLSKHSLYSLSNALMKRVEQGVPVKTLDLSMCTPDGHAEVLRSLTELVVHILGPEESFEERERTEFIWKTVARGPFIDNDNSG